MGQFKVVARCNLGQLGDRVRGQLRQVVKKAAFDVEAHAKAAMTEEKHGHLYGTHRASAPGEAPAIDTSNLANSIETRVDPDHPRAEVTVGAEYGAHLEFGTSAIAPRPFLGPAVEKVKPEFEQAVAATVKRAAEDAAL